jgi:hypothetical protein
MGRFLGVSGGVGFADNWRANVVYGQLIDFSNNSKPYFKIDSSSDSKPIFKGVSLDFGTRSQLGGTVYFIDQHVGGFTDRRATGGNLRYFDQGFSVMSMLDYDLQFRALNMMTVQGTITSNGTGTDYNFLIDRRRSPILDIRNAVNGTAITFASLVQTGRTTDAMIDLAKQRTSTSTLAQVGLTNHVTEKWNIGSDFTVSQTAGMPGTGQSSEIDGCVDTAGCVSAIPASGNTWTITGRLTGMGVFQPRDITNYSLSHTKGPLTTSEGFQISNHLEFEEKWTLDTAFYLGWQRYTDGGKSNNKSPTIRLAYKVRNNITLDSQVGGDWSKTSSKISSSAGVSESTTSSFRKYFGLGFRVDF